jgi:3-hydroxyisobutyrate dehydrogenase-like beta-hydroxyacid dehydrogenase
MDEDTHFMMWFIWFSMMNAFSEGLALAGKSGLSQQTLLDILV